MPATPTDQTDRPERPRRRRTSRARLGLSVAGVVALTVTLLPATSSAQTEPSASAAIPAPTVHYTFDGSTTDQAGGSTLTPAPACPGNPCNDSTGFGSDADGGFWTWTSSGDNGGGFRVSTNAEIGTTYTLALKFAFTETGPSWRKIIDYEDQTSDNGFYFFDGLLEFYPFTDEQSPSAYPADEVLDLIAVRQSTGEMSGTFTVYAVGGDGVLTEVFSVDDPTGESLAIGNGAGGTLLGFFFDDDVVSGESTSGGRVYDLRIWSGAALTADDIAEALQPPAPEPPVEEPPAPEAPVDPAPVADPVVAQPTVTG